MDRVNREPLASAVESLRNEVESMWNDIKISFDKIDRELDQTINRYKLSSYNSSSILYEEDDDYNNNTNNNNNNNNKNNNKHRSKPIAMTAINSGASSTSTVSSTSSASYYYHNSYRHRHHINTHSRTLSPIQQAFNNMMQHSPAPPRYGTPSAYTTPIQSHIISSPFYVKNRMLNYDSNHSEITDDGLDSSLHSKQPSNIEIHLSKSQQQLASELIDFNRNDTLIPAIPGLDPTQKSFKIDLTNPNDSPRSKQKSSSNSSDHEMDSNHSDGPQIVNDTENRMALINRISSHLEENENRNNKQKHNQMHLLEDITNISSVTTPHSSPPSESVENFLHKSKKREKIQPEFQYHKTPEPPIDVVLAENETIYNNNYFNKNSNNNNKSNIEHEHPSDSSIDYLFKDNHSDSSYDDEEDDEDDDDDDDDDDDGLVVISEETNGDKPGHRKRKSKSRLSIPRGLSNIDITADIASITECDTSPIAPPPPLEEAMPTPSNPDDVYPLSLPAIPQTSSIDHIVDAGQTPSDITSKHEKKKSMTQIQLQDLELDRKFNQQTNGKRKLSHSGTNHTAHSQNNYQAPNQQPLTPLAMMTQIGLEMPDITDFHLSVSDGTDGTELNTKTHSSDYKLPISDNMLIGGTMTTSISANSVPSPPTLNTNEYDEKQRDHHPSDSHKITPRAIGSEEYINLFNEDKEKKKEKEKEKEKGFKFGNRASLNTNNNITDINYENNRNLASGINRADSDYKPLINKDIDAILNEMKINSKNVSKTNYNSVMISPEAMKADLNNLSYSFDEFSNNFSHKIPVIISDEDNEYDEYDDDNNDNNDNDENIQSFPEIEETLLIIKKKWR